MRKITFKDYKLSDEILKSLEMLNFKSPTEVQSKVIPVALENRDILVKSQTGSGKTATFGIPLCEMVDWDENKPQALVLAPTRELAIQVKDDISKMGRFKRIKTCALYGKSSFVAQEKELKQKTHIVVGTPGRTIDHIKEGTFVTDNIKYLVSLGLDGIERYYPSYTDDDRRLLDYLVWKYQLYSSGGTDYHGANRGNIEIGFGEGDLKIPYSLIDSLKR